VKAEFGFPKAESSAFLGVNAGHFDMPLWPRMNILSALIRLAIILVPLVVRGDSQQAPVEAAVHLASLAGEWRVALISHERTFDGTLSSDRWAYNERFSKEAVGAANGLARQLYQTETNARKTDKFESKCVMMADLFLTAVLMHPPGPSVWNDLGVAKIHLNKHSGVGGRFSSLNQFVVASRVDSTPFER
jgi:hypothetical protein